MNTPAREMDKRRSIAWLCWIGRNAWVFNQDSWPQAKLEQLIWEATLDHGRTAWLRSPKLGPPDSVTGSQASPTSISANSRLHGCALRSLGLDRVVLSLGT